ncbi:hypothetical protein FIBSPDRAFT_945421 [Athelia psychrophila]|uniref:Uncharacterized protein n=1 Tax=Athelia psychrophila TaxID=1759441 RepID=A0A166TRC9_9AGAM|nr:hypothetical protein FIBSPDRAFT_945421 [Fibularhizoctonia sp. CBS 109695]
MTRDYLHHSATVYLARARYTQYLQPTKAYTFSPVFFRPASQSSCSSTTCRFLRYLLVALINPSNTSIKKVARYMDMWCSSSKT